ncbi:MAG: hypothetical protein IRZ16_09230 [Myxococcaceae bacterium]|nr:hypothetical protein [Myxococcaceae bacterium]
MSAAQSARVPERATGVRVVFAVVFLCIAAVGLVSAWPEVEHLAFALGHPFHSGAPPRPVALFGVGVVLAAGLGVLVTLLRGREVPLWLSAGVLVGAALCLVGTAGETPAGRSWAAADTALVNVGSKLQRQMVDRLQTTGTVPTSADAWSEALSAIAPGPSLARTRSFAQLPYTIRVQRTGDPLPTDLRPGELIVEVAPLGEAFRIHMVGFDRKGQVALLTDDQGREVVLTGAFNPELRPAASGPPSPVFPPPHP